MVADSGFLRLAGTRRTGWSVRSSNQGWMWCERLPKSLCQPSSTFRNEVEIVIQGYGLGRTALKSERRFLVREEEISGAQHLVKFRKHYALVTRALKPPCSRVESFYIWQSVFPGSLALALVISACTYCQGMAPHLFPSADTLLWCST